MNVLFIISTDDAETAYNAMRLANVAVKKEDEVSVFMLGKGVLFEPLVYKEYNKQQYKVNDGCDTFATHLLQKSHIFVWNPALASGSAYRIFKLQNQRKASVKTKSYRRRKAIAAAP